VSLVEELVLAVMLACTDAALGQAVVTDQRVPSRIRQGLNVESENRSQTAGLLRPDASVAERCALIEAEKANYAISWMCRLLEVARSSFYAWRNRVETPTAARRRMLAEQVRRVFANSRQTFGCRRVAAQLNREGHECSVEHHLAAHHGADDLKREAYEHESARPVRAMGVAVPEQQLAPTIEPPGGRRTARSAVPSCPPRPCPRVSRTAPECAAGRRPRYAT
jgi:hypothetical protein